MLKEIKQDTEEMNTDIKSIPRLVEEVHILKIRPENMEMKIMKIKGMIKTEV